MKNVPKKDRCRAKVYLPCHSEQTRCVGWRNHFGDHLCRAEGSVTGCNQETPVPLEITWPNRKSGAALVKSLRSRK